MLVSSPHAWGCFLRRAALCAFEIVFPTCVGVFPPDWSAVSIVYCLPHMRGGVSPVTASVKDTATSSPHAWGCFLITTILRPVTKVFPTCVGVFPAFQSRSDLMVCLPHMRGGVSTASRDLLNMELSSPHAWGCFFHHLRRDSAAGVFPTRVGVFPCSWPSS